MEDTSNIHKDGKSGVGKKLNRVAGGKFETETCSSSALSCSNFTMSCSGTETQEDKEPSTSGCSSFLTHTEKKRNKAEKKERVKEYLRELKSMVKPGGSGGTLTTLQHVLASMRKIKDVGKVKMVKDEHTDTCQSNMVCDVAQATTISLSNDGLPRDTLNHKEELQIIVSSVDNVIKTMSNNLRHVLGCQNDRWIGRSFDEFIHKGDMVTYKSVTRTEIEANMDRSYSDSILGKAKIVYLRLRQEMQQGASFDMQFEDMSNSSGFSGSAEHGRTQEKLYTVFYCIPLISPYTSVEILPEMKTFEMRQTLFCSICQVEPTMIPLMGYFPQEVIGVSIFDLFHNDDLQRLFTIFEKVIALNGVPYKSGKIRLLTKNGCWIWCVTEWSSFVNPWSKRLEFVIGKHTVVKGPDNMDVFSERFSRPTIEETPQSVLQARQKIKNLLLQPVETIYLGDNEKSKDKGSGRSVAIIDVKEMLSSDDADMRMMRKQDTIFKNERNKTATHGAGILFKENAISRAYEQLSYTSCIKKFLLNQPHSFSSESDQRRSSSESGCDDDSRNGKPVERWFRGSYDDMMTLKRGRIATKSDDIRSLPALNDPFWKKRIIASDREFDFDISVPKPPSFGSSTKVLLSEQEHLENLDPVNIREQLQPPTPGDMPSPHEGNLGSMPVMNLTRESLWKHTLLQEQLYLASASPERNILFMNESRDADIPIERSQQPNALKRIHSPDKVVKRCKAGRPNEDCTSIPMRESILNPIFPLSDSSSSLNSLPKVTRMVVPMQMYPIVSLPTTNVMPTKPTNCSSTMPGVTFRQGEMMGFQSSAGMPQLAPNIGLPIPVHQLNSYLMQQGNMLSPHLFPQPNRMKVDREKVKERMIQSSSESSSTEDTGSSLYLLESSSNSIKHTYNQLVMQSLAQQMPQQGVEPATWLENINYTENVQYRYQLLKTQPKRSMKKFREDIDKLKQSDMVLEQFKELMEECSNKQGPLLDQESDFLLFDVEEEDRELCSCMSKTCCQDWSHGDHGSMKAMKSFHKLGKKKDKFIKKARLSLIQDASIQKDSNVNMDVDSSHEAENKVPETIYEEMVLKSMKSENCCGSTKSRGGDSDIHCDMSSVSINSLDTSEVTPSDQRSNNENGSSLKESDADVMSKRSDSSSCDKQQNSSESDSESKNKVPEDLFDNLFTSLHMCFPNSHEQIIPWLADVEFDEDIKMRYHLETDNLESVLERDRQQLAMRQEPGLVDDQLAALMGEMQGSNVDISSMIMSSEPGSSLSEDQDATLVG